MFLFTIVVGITTSYDVDTDIWPTARTKADVIGNVFRGITATAVPRHHSCCCSEASQLLLWTPRTAIAAAAAAVFVVRDAEHPGWLLSRSWVAYII